VVKLTKSILALKLFAFDCVEPFSVFDEPKLSVGPINWSPALNCAYADAAMNVTNAVKSNFLIMDLFFTNLKVKVECCP